MTICRAVHDRNNPYMILNKSINSDNRLSLKAKGAWMYAFDKPADWKFYFKDFLNHCTDGERSLCSAIKELEKFGYLKKVPRYDTEKNRLNGWEWYFFETPKTEEEIKIILQKPTFCGVQETCPSENAVLLSNKEELNNNKKKFVAAPPPEKKENCEKPVHNSDSDVSAITIRGKENFPTTINQTDLYRKVIGAKVSWSSDEIRYAWKVLANYRGIVYDWWRFLEGTVEKHRNSVKSKNISGVKGWTNGKENQKRKNSEQKKLKRDSSEKDSSARPSQNFTSLMKYLKR